MTEGGEMRGNDKYKIWVSRERKELFRWWSKKYLSWLFKAYHLLNKIKDPSFKPS